MSDRKVDSVSPGDVPAPLVVALILYLVAVFVPIVAITPDLPSALPPLIYSSDAVFRYHRDARSAPALSFLDEQFALVTRAAAARDAPGTASAQRQFVAFLADARATTAETRAAVREHFLGQFLSSVDSGRRDPLVLVAQRHQLAGMYAAPAIDRATLIAWFDFRWEALAAPEVLRGERVTLAALLARIPAQERPVAVAWALGSSCEALLGVRPGSALTARELQQCAAARREFVDAAASLDPRYPRGEALAAVDVLLARSLQALSRTTRDDEVRADARSLAHDAFERAEAAYTLLVEHDGTRRFRRYLRGALEGSATD